jgi:hypothetical protein
MDSYRGASVSIPGHIMWNSWRTMLHWFTFSSEILWFYLAPYQLVPHEVCVSLTMQHIIISSVSKFRTAALTLDLTGYTVRKLARSVFLIILSIFMSDGVTPHLLYTVLFRVQTVLYTAPPNWDWLERVPDVLRDCFSTEYIYVCVCMCVCVCVTYSRLLLTVIDYIPFCL